jgi:hypothetical protein
MDLSIKVNLVIELPGSTMYSKQECLKELTDKDNNTVIAEDIDKYNQHTLKGTDKKGVPYVIHYKTRKAKPALQVLAISKYAYDYMISDECPEWERKNDWKLKNADSRLSSHLHRIASDMRGTVKAVDVYED